MLVLSKRTTFAIRSTFKLHQEYFELRKKSRIIFIFTKNYWSFQTKIKTTRELRKFVWRRERESTLTKSTHNRLPDIYLINFSIRYNNNMKEKSTAELRRKRHVEIVVCEPIMAWLDKNGIRIETVSASVSHTNESIFRFQKYFINSFSSNQTLDPLRIHVTTIFRLETRRTV